MRIPFWLLKLLPMWDYICPKCRREVEKNSYKCVHCGERYGIPIRVPPKILKDPKALEDYVHKHIFPRISKTQRDYLAQYFTEIFSDGFESGDLSEWDVSFADDGCSVVGSDTTHPHHGSYNLKATIYAGCSARWAAAGKQLNGLYNPVHIRAMNCIFENEPDTSDTYRVMSFSNDEHGAAAAYAGIKYYNSAWRWWVYVRNNGSFVNYYGGTVNFDTEYCMEFCVYRDSSTGYARLYVNGSLEVQATGLNNSDRNLNYANVGFTYSAAGSSQGIFYADCVVVADSYIGPESETYTKTWQTDVLFKKLGITKSLGADAAFQKRDIQLTADTDALFKKLGITESFGADAAFQKRDIQLTADADVLFKRLGVEKTVDIDVLLKALGIQKTAQVDALFKKLDLLETFGIDVNLIKQDIIKSFGIDAKFGAVATYELNRQIDVLFKKLGIPQTFSADVILQKKDLVSTFGIDTNFLNEVLASANIDTMFQKTLTTSKAFDAVFMASPTSTFGIDVCLGSTNKAFYLPLTVRGRIG